MGNIIVNIPKKAVKPFKSYNLESRVYKVINKEKATPAPRHNSEQPFLHMSKDQQIAIRKKLLESDHNLLERLQQVYVTSTDPKPPEEFQKSNRPMPFNREVIEQPVYGYHEPKTIPFGKLTLKTAMDLISKHQEDSEKWTTVVLAKEYNLEVEQTEQLLKHFKTFVLVIPTPSKDMDKAKPSVVPQLLGARSVLRVPKLEESKDIDSNATTTALS